jgi:hypothetical protein
MKKVINFFVAVVFILCAQSLNARKLSLKNYYPGSSVTVKQINIAKGSNNLLGKANNSGEFVIGTLEGPRGNIELNVTNDAFMLQFVYPRFLLFKARTANIPVEKGTADKNIEIDINNKIQNR